MMRTVLKDDFRNARRSRVVLAVIGVFAGLTAVMFASEISIYDDAYRTLFDLSFFVAVILPIFLAPLTYVAIAGDRASGAIKYAIGLPNSRAEYFAGKWASRAGVAVAAVVAAVAVGYLIGATQFTNGASLARFLTFAGIAGLYAAAMAGTFVGLSAVTASRSRAMIAVFGVYFLLIPFWIGLLPVISLETLIDFAETLLGITLSEETSSLLTNLSPAVAFLSALEPVYDGVITEYSRIEQNYSGGGDNLAHALWFDIVVLLGWGLLVPALGYLKFRVSELS